MSQVPDKASARRRLAARRAALTSSEREIADGRVRERLLATGFLTGLEAVFVYISIEPETDTRRLIDTLHAHGTLVAVPRIIDRSRMIAVPFRAWGALRAGPLGIPAPVETEPCESPIGLAIVPGLGFSSRGDRLGYGGGYYDRWLALHPETRRIAIAYDCQIDDTILSEPHDVIMDGVITEHRTLHFHRPGE
ncbi:MAG: 5-formyltetrahydrofolate cyclo-ligase [Gammaproteobacteria bacterium]|nr:5-formyltetrahydrofolate cyclo-ligase [Gammaproteobacteria bacterium]